MRVAPAILRLSLPNLVGFFASLAMATIDGIVAGEIGDGALAAIALVLPLQMLLMQTSNGAFGGSAAGMVARALGAGDHGAARSATGHAVTFALFIAAALALIGLIGASALTEAMGGRGGVLGQAAGYARIILVGALLLWITGALGGVLRGAGRMWLPASGFITMAIVHVLLCRPLAQGVGGFAGLGVEGIAVSYLIAQTVGLLPLVYGVYRLRLLTGPADLRLQRGRAAALTKLALPAIIATMLTNVAVMMAVRTASLYGQEALVGFGLAARLEYVLVPFAFSIGMALIALAGQARGAGDDGLARRLALAGVLGSGALLGLLGIVAALMPQLWLGLFDMSEQAYATAVRYLRIVAPFYAFFGIAVTGFFAAQAFGRITPVMIGAALRLVTLAIGGYWAHTFFPDDITPFCWVVAAAFTLIGVNNLVAIRAMSRPRPAAGAPAG